MKIAQMRIENLKKKIDKVDNEEEEESLYYDMEDLLKFKNKLDNDMVFHIFLGTSFLGIFMAYASGIKFLEMLEESVNPVIDIIVTGLVLGGWNKAFA